MKIVNLARRRYAIVAERDSDRIEAFRVNAGLTLSYSRIRIPTDPRPSHLFVVPSPPTVFVTSSEGNSVTIFPGGARLTLSINGPRGVSASRDFSGTIHVYVANQNSRQIAYYSGPVGTTPTFVGILNVSRSPFAIASQFELPIGAPPNPPSLGDRILCTSLADDSLDDVGR